MAGGTLVVSRNEKLHSHYKKRFMDLGFGNVEVTCMDKDGLDLLIDDMRPGLVVIGAEFYKHGFVYLVSKLLRRHKKLNIAVVATGPSAYPADKAMVCIANGVKSFVIVTDGIEQFYSGLRLVKEGKAFVSPSVVERMEIRDELPRKSVEITERELAVLHYVRDGHTAPEIADELGISERTVHYHKSEMYVKFGVRNEVELLAAAEEAGVLSLNDPVYYSSRYELSPKASLQIGIRADLQIRSFYK